MRRLILFAALVAVLPARAQDFLGGVGYSNDDIEFAFPLAPNAPSEVLTASTVGATPDPLPQFRQDALGASCISNENDKSVWWYFRATTTGTATIDLAGSTFDTVLSVYSVDGTVSATQVGCNDDRAVGMQTSLLTNLAVTAGTYYYVRVSGYQTAEGTVQIAMASTAVTTSPHDPRFPPPYYGTYFGRPGPRVGFNTGATVDPGETTAPASCSASPGYRSVAWSYVPTQTGFLTIDLAGSAFDTVLLVTNQSGALLACDDDNGNSLQSRIADFPVTIGGVYFIRVASFEPVTTGVIRFNTSLSTTVASEGDAPEAGVSLRAPTPNPTTGRAAFTFALEAPGAARLAVVDALGREVAVLFDGPVAAGETTAQFDGSALPAGVYAARLSAGGRVETQRVTVVR